MIVWFWSGCWISLSLGSYPKKHNNPLRQIGGWNKPTQVKYWAQCLAHSILTINIVRCYPSFIDEEVLNIKECDSIRLVGALLWPKISWRSFEESFSSFWCKNSLSPSFHRGHPLARFFSISWSLHSIGEEQWQTVQNISKSRVVIYSDECYKDGKTWLCDPDCGLASAFRGVSAEANWELNIARS